jgi:hypothetical protein
MRKTNSLFDQVVKFINSQPIGTRFNVNDLYNACTENYTDWKKKYNDPNYVTRLYAGLIRNCGGLIKMKKNTWNVIHHIPDWVTLANVQGHYYGSGIKPKRWDPKEKDEASSFIEACERLDGLLFILNETSFLMEDDCKFIYKYETGKITKHRVHKTYNTNGKIKQVGNLIDAIHLLSNLTGISGMNIVDSMLLEVEDENQMISEKNPTLSQKAFKESTESTTLKRNVKGMLAIEFADPRGKEVFVERTCNNWQKAIIKSFGVDCTEEGDNNIYDVQVEWSSDGRYETFDDMSNFLFNKDEVKAKLLTLIDLL